VRARDLTVTAVLLLHAGLGWSAEETSLADKAEVAARSRNKKTNTPSPGQILTNEDLRHAKGNLIVLTATPSPAATAAPAVAVLDLPLADQRDRAARLRGAIDEVQRQLLESTADQRPALEQRFKGALDELVRVHEAIGAQIERARLAAGTTTAP
jgi:hypothetical protein